MAKLSKLDRATAKRAKLRVKGEAAIKAGDQLKARSLRQRYDKIGDRVGKKIGNIKTSYSQNGKVTPNKSITALDSVTVTGTNKKTNPKGFATMGSNPIAETSGFGLINKVISNPILSNGGTQDISTQISDASKTGEIKEPVMALKKLNTAGIQEVGDMGITTTLDVRETGDYAEQMIRTDFDKKAEKLTERREGESRRQYKKRLKTWKEGFSGGDKQYPAYRFSTTLGSGGEGKIALGSTKTFTNI